MPSRVAPPSSRPHRENAADWTPGMAAMRSSTRLVEIEQAPVLVAGRGRVHPHQQQLLETEAERLRPQVQQRAREERGADEQHERQRHLQRDQRSAGDEPGPAGAATRDHAAEREPGVGGRGAEGREQAAPEPDDQAHADREGQHPRARAEGQLDRRLVLVERREQAAADDEGQHDAGRGAQRGEHDTLGEQLADEPAPSRAERQAHRHLALAGRGAHQQQAGHVGAGDAQHGGHHRREQVQRPRVGPAQPVEALAAGVDDESRQTRRRPLEEIRRQRLA